MMQSSSPAGVAGPPDHAASPRATHRLTGIDVARGVALFGMMATHVLALTTDTGEATWVAAFSGRASALFAVLAGFSIVLSTRSTLASGSPRAWRAASTGLLIRAACITAIGLVLGTISSAIAIILVNYGLIFALAIPFLRVPRRHLGWIAPAWLLLTPVVGFAIRRSFGLEPAYDVPDLFSLLSPVHLLDALVLDGYYPVLQWMGYILLGMFLASWDWRARATQVTVLLSGIAGALMARIVSTLLLLSGGQDALEASIGPIPATDPGSWEFRSTHGSFGTVPTDTWWWLAFDGPHSGTPFDLAETAGIACAVIGLCCLLAGLLAPLGRTIWLLAPLSVPGSMPLSVYSAHVVLHEIFLPIPVSLAFEMWVQVGLFVSLPILWRLALGPRGPLELVVSGAAHAGRDAVLQHTPGR